MKRIMVLRLHLSLYSVQEMIIFEQTQKHVIVFCTIEIRLS